jgi:hypothetical protein
LRVEWAIACRSLTVNGNDASIEGIAVDTFWVDSLPQELALPVLARIAFTTDECETPHHFECYLMAPALSAVDTLEFDITPGPPPAHHPEGWENKLFLPIAATFETEREGPYGLDIYIDGRFRWQVPFRVILGSPPPGAS